jgi:glycine cleavage system H protein
MSDFDVQQLKFTKTHEWIMMEGKQATVGITAYAQQEISDVVYVELPKVGRVVRQGEETAVVESVKAAFSIYAPVGGKVIQVNERLTADPGLLNRSPYGDGWIFKLEVEDASEAESLMEHAQYERMVKGQQMEPPAGTP